LRALLDEFETPANIFAQSASRISAVKGISLKMAEKVADWQREVDFASEMEMAEKGGVRITTLADDDYPEILKGIYDPPLCLYIRGELPDCNANTVAVIGSRRVSNYGRKMARHLSESAVMAGWKVISGLAYGVDAIAHHSTVQAGGVTVAVLGGGLARIHPQDHIPLARDIIEGGGAVISEFPMKYPVSRQSFPRRNRIVSGLSNAVLVVEAGLESGALITAELGIEQGKAVFAVPGHVDNPQARGCHKLIKEGAKLTEDFKDILEDFDFLPGFGCGKASEVSQGELFDENAVFPGLSDDERKILELLQIDCKSLDVLASESGIPAGSLLAVLMKLEIKMLVTQQPGKIYALRR
jgi:DNA processing protein